MSNIVSLNNDFAGLPKKFKYNGWDVRVPNGQYDAVMETWVTFQAQDKQLVWIFSIIESGAFNGLHVPAFFSIKRHKGKTRERGGFVAKPRGKLMEWYCRLLPHEPKPRPDRLALSKLNGIYRITTTEVLKNSNGDLHPEQLIYSKVSKVDF